jgi:hypothetical protein
MTPTIYRNAQIALVTLSAFQASADVIVINNIQLDGFQPAVPTLSPGTGIATMTINTETRFVEISGSYEGLLAPVTGAHLHGPADFGEPSAFILVLINPTFGTEGTFSAARGVSQTILDHILNSQTFINIHTTAHPSGEIRGQVVIPSPMSVSMLALSGTFIAARRRR